MKSPVPLLLTLGGLGLVAISYWCGGHAAVAPVPSDSSLDLPTEVDSSGWSDLGKQKVSANRKYSNEKHLVQDHYRQRVVRWLPVVDQVEVLRLGGKINGSESPEDGFEILPYRLRVPIVQTIRLGPEAREKVKREVENLLSSDNSPQGGAWDHQPIYGLRLYTASDGLVFTTSLSWETQNYFVQFPDDLPGTATWVGFTGAQKLRGLLDEAFREVAAK